MESVTVHVLLTGSGIPQNVVLNKQLSQVMAVDLVEVLTTGWNAGVSSGALVKLGHPQLHVCGLTDRSQTGTVLLVDTLNPHQKYTEKRLATGEIATVNSFQISVSDVITGVPVTFTQLHMILRFTCKAELNTAGGRLGNALTPFPLLNSAQPGQTRFNN